MGSALQVFEPSPQSSLSYPDVPNGRPRPAWDPNFDKILKAGAAAGPAKLRRAIERVKKLDARLTEQQILKRTGELKLIRWKVPWTRKEKELLFERAREFSAADIARELGRTRKAVYQQLSRRRVSARFQDGYTQYDLAEALHVSRFRTRQWVRRGWLTLYEGRIKDRALVRFLESHSEEIDVARLDQDFLLWLRSLGLREIASHPPMWWITRKHSLKEHVCGRCGRKVRGNSFHRHLKRCRTKAPESRKSFLLGVSPR